MTQLSDDDGRKYELERAKLLWDEYKYRHEHCWRTVFQLTTAIVILSVIPYVHKDVVMVLTWGILALPILSLALALFSLFLMNRELDSLRKIKDEYRKLQATLFEIRYTRKSMFKSIFLMYLFTLVSLSLVNLWLVARIWIPRSLAPH
jgi:hypothetical protein